MVVYKPMHSSCFGYFIDAYKEGVNMNRKIISIVLIALLGMALLASCGTDPASTIVGTWECRDTSSPHDWYCNFSFTDDGRFLDGDRDAGNWRLFDNTLTLDFDDYAAYTLSYSFSGSNRLTITGDELRVILNRK